MSLFRYQATNDDGQQVTGTVDAPDQRAAMSALEDASMANIVLSPEQATSSSVPTSSLNELSTPTPPTRQEPVASAFTQPPKSSLFETLRLYAAWLLAWYGLVMGLGYYTHVRTLTFDIPFVEGLFLSSLVFSFLLAMFLFLLMGSLVRLLRGGLITGSFASIVGVVLFFIIKASF